MNDQELKRKLRNILAHNNLSMNQLAKEVGVSEGTVRKLLNEEVDLTPSARIISYLYDLDDNNNTPDYKPEYQVWMGSDLMHVVRDVSFIELFNYLRNLEADNFDLVIARDNHISIIPKNAHINGGIR